MFENIDDEEIYNIDDDAKIALIKMSLDTVAKDGYSDPNISELVHYMGLDKDLCRALFNVVFVNSPSHGKDASALVASLDYAVDLLKKGTPVTECVERTKQNLELMEAIPELAGDISTSGENLPSQTFSNASIISMMKQTTQIMASQPGLEPQERSFLIHLVDSDRTCLIMHAAMSIDPSTSQEILLDAVTKSSQSSEFELITQTVNKFSAVILNSNNQPLIKALGLSTDFPKSI